MSMRFIRSRVGISVFAFVVACCLSETRAETTVAMKDLPSAARAAAEKLTAGGSLKRITLEKQAGGDAYVVEANVSGKTREFTLAADGTLLAEEEDLAFADLPEAVRTAAEAYFGTTHRLHASKELAKDVTSYEVEGKKSGKAMSVKFNPAGALLEEEQDED